MAQVALFHVGEKVVQKGMKTPPRAGDPKYWFKEAKRALQKELGPNWRDIGHTKFEADLDYIKFALADGLHQIVIDRKANMIGR